MWGSCMSAIKKLVCSAVWPQLGPRRIPTDTQAYDRATASRGRFSLLGFPSHAFPSSLHTTKPSVSQATLRTVCFATAHSQRINGGQNPKRGIQAPLPLAVVALRPVTWGRAPQYLYQGVLGRVSIPGGSRAACRR